MRSSFCTVALSLLTGLQFAMALPAQRGGNNNAQLTQILQGTGLQGIKTTQLNALIRNLQAAGVCAGAGAGTGNADAGNAEGEAEEGEGSKYSYYTSA